MINALNFEGELLICETLGFINLLFESLNMFEDSLEARTRGFSAKRIYAVNGYVWPINHGFQYLIDDFIFGHIDSDSYTFPCTVIEHLKVVRAVSWITKISTVLYLFSRTVIHFLRSIWLHRTYYIDIIQEFIT